MSKGLEQLKFLRRNYCVLKREREYACDIIEEELRALELIKKLNVDPFGWTLVIIDDRYFLRCISGSLELSKENYLILKGQGY